MISTDEYSVDTVTELSEVHHIKELTIQWCRTSKKTPGEGKYDISNNRKSIMVIEL
jgi:hypothetical protein